MNKIKEKNEKVTLRVKEKMKGHETNSKPAYYGAEY